MLRGIEESKHCAKGNHTYRILIPCAFYRKRNQKKTVNYTESNTIFLGNWRLYTYK